MFGFMRGSRFDKTYRQVYAQCCVAQRRRFGVDSLVFLSYESILLYALAVDAGMCARPPATAVTCCRLRSRTGNWPDFRAELAAFCSCFSLLLAAIKLDDDVRDDGSLLARMVRWKFRRRFAATRDYFTGLDARFEQRIDGCIARHLCLERGASGLSLNEYVKPTADGFAYLFDLFARQLPSREIEPTFGRVGRALGAAIISFDCASDYRRDVRLGRFNPLSSQSDARRAMEFAMRSLSQIGWECSQAFGADSIGGRLARLNFERVGAALVASSRQPSRKPRGMPISPMTAWTLRRGFCDCDCDCGGCDAGDLGNGCSCICDECFCFPDCCWCWGSERERRAGNPTSAPEKSHEATLVGLTGQAVGPLNPTGFVMIGQKRIPAKSEGQWIDDGSQVAVVSERPAGVVVRPTDETR